MPCDDSLGDHWGMDRFEDVAEVKTELKKRNITVRQLIVLKSEKAAPF